MTQYIIKTLPKYAAPGFDCHPPTLPYLGMWSWVGQQADARRFNSAREASEHIGEVLGYYAIDHGARVVRLKPRKK